MYNKTPNNLSYSHHMANPSNSSGNTSKDANATGANASRFGA